MTASDSRPVAATNPFFFPKSALVIFEVVFKVDAAGPFALEVDAEGFGRASNFFIGVEEMMARPKNPLGARLTELPTLTRTGLAIRPDGQVFRGTTSMGEVMPGTQGFALASGDSVWFLEPRSRRSQAVSLHSAKAVSVEPVGPPVEIEAGFRVQAAASNWLLLVDDDEVWQLNATPSGAVLGARTSVGTSAGVVLLQSGLARVTDFGVCSLDMTACTRGQFGWLSSHGVVLVGPTALLVVNQPGAIAQRLDFGPATPAATNFKPPLVEDWTDFYLLGSNGLVLIPALGPQMRFQASNLTPALLANHNLQWVMLIDGELVTR